MLTNGQHGHQYDETHDHTDHNLDKAECASLTLWRQCYACTGILRLIVDNHLIERLPL